MSRYANDLPVSLPDDAALKIISDYLLEQGFNYRQVTGTWVWTQGAGPAIVPQFVTAEPDNGVVHLQAWIADVPKTPGVYTGEHDLRGLSRWAVKSTLRYRVKQLEERLTTSAAS